MKMFAGKSNNKGFSLIELVVIIAIMALGIGVVSLSVSLVTGAQARKAFEKMESQLDEAKTGAMSRFDETLTITYKTKDTSVDLTTGSGTGNQDQDGFYAVKELMTLKAKPDLSDSTKIMADKQSLGTEQVYLSDDRVEMTIYFKDASGAEESYLIENGGSVVFSFERATGLYKDIQITKADGSTRSGQPVAFEAKSGMRTYRMEFVPETGKHVKVDM